MKSYWIMLRYRNIKFVIYRPLAHDVKRVYLEDNYKDPTFNRVNN